jgi:hypothetical protein
MPARRDRRAGTTDRPGTGVGEVSAAANSAALPNRSAGSLASAVSTAASIAGDTVFRCRVGGGGSSVRTLAMIACAEGPVNGGSPTSIS